MKQNRTRAAIADAFTRLLKEHTSDKITVRMITDEVGCSRKTFYYYFSDIYDVSQYVCEQRISAFLADEKKNTTAHEGLQAFMDYVNQERSVVLNLFHGYGKEALEQFAWQSVETNTRRVITARPDAADLSQDKLEMLIRMYAYMAFGMIVDWFSNEMSEDRSQALDLAICALPHFIEGLKQD